MGMVGATTVTRLGRDRPNVPRRQAVREVKNGLHPGYHTLKINGQEYVRDNPDNSKKDNVND
jgi:hypothetical protein